MKCVWLLALVACRVAVAVASITGCWDGGGGGRVVGAGVLQSHGCNAGTRDTCIQIKSNKYTLYIPLLYITNNRERERATTKKLEQ